MAKKWTKASKLELSSQYSVALALKITEMQDRLDTDLVRTRQFECLKAPYSLLHCLQHEIFVVVDTPPPQTQIEEKGMAARPRLSFAKRKRASERSSHCLLVDPYSLRFPIFQSFRTPSQIWVNT